MMHNDDFRHQRMYKRVFISGNQLEYLEKCMLKLQSSVNQHAVTNLNFTQTKIKIKPFQINPSELFLIWHL